LEHPGTHKDIFGITPEQLTPAAYTDITDA
jgi:hypothetical protein